jgi:DNA modification methylase
MHEAAKNGEQFDLSVFSPPFSSLYTYSNNPADMGNSRESDDEFILHFRFFTDALFPLIKEGRNVCVHVQNPARSMTNHGYTGIWDMRGEIIRLFESSGFHYYGEATIWKNPQAQSIRTKTQCLTFSQFVKDSLKSRPALADYLLIFKKGYGSDTPCTGEKQKNSHGAMERSDVPNDNWIDWASPIWLSKEEGIYMPYQTAWFDILETDTLNYRMARQEEDERHLCPLQLDLIERCVRLWSNEGETVFSPFAGIGSEGYVSLKWKRNFIGTELKPEYADCANMNCQKALEELEAEKCQLSLSL